MHLDGIFEDAFVPTYADKLNYPSRYSKLESLPEKEMCILLQHWDTAVWAQDLEAFEKIPQLLCTHPNLGGECQHTQQESRPGLSGSLWNGVCKSEGSLMVKLKDLAIKRLWNDAWPQVIFCQAVRVKVMDCHNQHKTKAVGLLDPGLNIAPSVWLFRFGWAALCHFQEVLVCFGCHNKVPPTTAQRAEVYWCSPGLQFCTWISPLHQAPLLPYDHIWTWLITSVVTLFPNKVTLRYWELGLQHRNFGRTQFTQKPN